MIRRWRRRRQALDVLQPKKSLASRLHEKILGGRGDEEATVLARTEKVERGYVNLKLILGKEIRSRLLDESESPNWGNICEDSKGIKEGRKGREALPAALYAMGFAPLLGRRHGEGGRERAGAPKNH